MKYLIAGLGNMGPDYDNTRHNIGFDIVDALAKEFEAEWKDEKKAFVTQFKHKGRTFHLIKPTTFMNLSGKAVLYWFTKHKIKPENLLVIVDDLNLDFGKIRLRGKGSDGGHNGLRHINQTLGGNRYARLRIGIGNDFYTGQQVNHVLGEWSDEEREKLPEIIKKGTNVVKSFATIGLARTMTQYNR
ncbi:MAG: aminoacyl-tRNA hydrolase [Bacteroidota bacterium]